MNMNNRQKKKFIKCIVAIVPCNVKVWDKEAAQKYCDALQEVINEMER